MIIEEQLISFDVAKLAKEKGFNINCHKCYKLDYPKYGKLESCSISYDEDFGWIEYNHHRGTDVKIYPESFIFVPTQSFLQKWLREVHDIDVIALSVRFTGYLEIGYYTYAVKGIQPMKNYRFDTYEQALEQGLIEALNLID